MGYARTALLLAAMTGLFLAAGYLIGGQQGMIFALVAAGVMNIVSYWYSDQMVLRMYGARQVEGTVLNEVVEGLAARAGLPTPKVYLMDNPQPNAFATGRNPEHAAVAATTGIVQLLSREELAGVMAHELAHVRNRDSLTMTITAVLAGAIGMLANSLMFFGMMGGNRDRNAPLGGLGALLVMILAPLAAMVVQMAISRSREYEADRVGAEISGTPLALASALRKISQGAAVIDNRVAEANPASAHLFIVNPLHAHAADGLFSTHPNVENRIARLMEMAGSTGRAPSAPDRAPTRPSAIPSTVQRRKGPWG